MTVITGLLYAPTAPPYRLEALPENTELVMSMVLFSKLTGGRELAEYTSDLPNPVMLAVGSDSIYAFDYKPRGFKFKIKKEVARWPRVDLDVAIEETERMAYFTMSTPSGETYPMEVATVMGAKEVVDLFLTALRGS